MSSESQDVAEFLEEIYADEWKQYVERLGAYTERQAGWLLEDPRQSENKTLSGLFGLKLAEEELEGQA